MGLSLTKRESGKAMSFSYSEEAKKRISQLGQVEIFEFIEEINLSLRKVIYRGMPRVQGFRQGSQAELREKQKRLVGHLAHLEMSQDFDWKSFSLLWEAWGRDRLGDNFPKGELSEPSGEAGLSFIHELFNLFPKASREDVTRLYIFSGFPKHPAIAEALEKFRFAAVLSRDKIIDEIPERMEKVEEYIHLSETFAEHANARIEKLETNIVNIAKSQERVREDVSQIAKDVGGKRRKLEQVYLEFEKIKEALCVIKAGEDKLLESSSRYEDELDRVERNLTILSARGEKWDELSDELSEAKKDIKRLLSREGDWQATAKAVGDIYERMDELELLIKKAGSPPNSAVRRPSRIIENKITAPFLEINNISSACDIIASNFQAVGVVKGPAKDMARQTVAALITGQMIQFSGSIADLLADALAAAVGGSTYHEWRVPVGLVSDEETSDCIDIVSDSTGCLLLKGANLSAFEVYGAAIRDIIVSRQFAESDYGHLALIAAWAQGPATFPDGGTLSELGPVFDTDLLRTRGVFAKLPGLQFGRLAEEAWAMIGGVDTDKFMPELSHLREFLDDIGFNGGSLWRRMVCRTYIYLRMMPGSVQEEDLNLIFLNWVIPWAKALGKSEKELERISQDLASRRTITDG